MAKKLLIVLLALVASLCLVFGMVGCFGNDSNSDSDSGSAAVVKGELVYTLTFIDDNEYEVTYSGTDATEIVILSEYNGLPVISIGNEAFSGCTSLTSITIPDGVTTIGSYAFRDCTSLTSITIPDSVTYIYAGAFYGCTSLTSITIGNNVISIFNRAFSDCTSLTSITIPESVTFIGSHAFYNCTSLTSVTFKNSVGGWYVSESTETKGTRISGEDLSDTAAATYLTGTYCKYFWKCS